MNKIECRELLTEIAAVDNRKVSQETLDIWTDILKHIPLDIALEAHRMARKSESVGYLEPKHIVGFAREAAFALDRAKPKPAEKEFQKVDQPTCRDHQLPLLSCRPCCHAMSKQRHLNDNQLLLWAKENIYA